LEQFLVMEAVMHRWELESHAEQAEQADRARHRDEARQRIEQFKASRGAG
jgi:hypothetical protein